MNLLSARIDPHASSPARLTPAAYNQIQELMYRCFGIDLGPSKRDLVESRLAGRLRSGGYRSYDDYCDYLLHEPTGQELSALADALTTNFTSFFREPEHFDFLERRVVPELASQKRVSFWSAGCSSGEEPFSMACFLMDRLDSSRLQIDILATDISRRTLGAASQGIYAQDRFASLSEAWRKRFLLRGQGRWAGTFRFKPEVRKLIRFRYLNLHTHFPEVGTFQVIFCRNVMIYFDNKSRASLLHRLAQQLEPGGYLFVGHAESVAAIAPSLRFVEPAVYRDTRTQR